MSDNSNSNEKWISRFSSPNFDERRGESCVEFLIIHYTECDLETSLRLLCDGDAENPVSSHYLIDEDGITYSLVNEFKRAWHCGKSYWKGCEDINSRSIGIELVNPGHGLNYRPFPVKQMESLLDLSCDIVRRHSIPQHHILGHSDIAPGRKVDPGELFDWRWLAEQGVGLFHQDPSFSSRLDIPYVQELLHHFGYKVPLNGLLDDETRAVIKSFQMHYSPERIDGEIDALMVSRLENLLSRIS